MKRYKLKLILERSVIAAAQLIGFRPHRFGCVTLVLLILSHSSIASNTTIGWIENAVLEPSKLLIRAKIDTGAKSSSLNAQHLETFTRASKTWVRFKLVNRAKESTTIEAPLIRMVKIKRHQGVSQARPVILMRICLGNVKKETEVNLINRSGFNYQLLIGREFLAKQFIVDPARKDLHPPSCKQ